MSIPAAYEREIQALESRVRLEKPTDILQFCAEHFFRRLADERAQTLAQQSSTTEPAPKSSPQTAPATPAAPAAMSSAATFTSPFAVNWNPTGGASGADSRKDMGPSSSTDLMDVIEEDENDTVTSPTAPSFSLSNTGGRRTPFGQGDGPADGPPSMRSPPNPDSYPPQYNFGRRTSVSAESLKPNADNNDNWSPPTFPKTPEQLERLKKAIEGNFLFNHLDDEQSAQILGALVEKPIPAKDIKVCPLRTHVMHGDQKLTWPHAGYYAG